ncbi:hypothetical protein CDV55_105554 [Aspergillus turcosus]|uniref:Uncharacterized protein n=1 Tax=Aspergillus turcosus TaxID=1245748 RepID=A0A229YGW0_9EURO|nr:hypothetical protein CDV55_105554 [Aspergillus turcosus]RLL98545.1 hypothetical protein CFD26_102875 [Aspergillus turcosus]
MGWNGDDSLKIFNGDGVEVDDPFDDSTMATPIVESTEGNRPGTSTASLPSQIPKTPVTAHSTRKLVETIRAKQPDLSPTIERFFRGALFQSDLLSLYKKRWEEVLAEQRKPTNGKRSKKQVKMAKFLYAKDVKDHLEGSEAQEVEEIWIRNWIRHGRDLQGLLDAIEAGEGIRVSPSPTPNIPSNSEPLELTWIDETPLYAEE